VDRISRTPGFAGDRWRVDVGSKHNAIMNSGGVVHRGWLVAAVSAMAVGIAVLGGTSWWVCTHLTHTMVGIWANAVGVLLPVLTAVVTVSGWLLRKAWRPNERLDEVLSRLRGDVHDLWSREAATRGMLPCPLRLRWQPTDDAGLRIVDVRGCAVPAGGGNRVAQSGVARGSRAGGRGGGGPLGWLFRSSRQSSDPVAGQVVVSVTTSGCRSGERLLSGSLRDPRSGDLPAAWELVEAMADESVCQLVVVGPAGAGKTTLAILYTLAALSAPDPLEPVPVPLSLAGWDPRTMLDEWTAEQVSRRHPGVPLVLARRLVQERMIVPVLDGLDEMPAGSRVAAMGELERAAGAGLRMLVTCRTEEYAETVAETGVLPQADVVEIQPVGLDDAITYLTQREPRGSVRWSRVVAGMRRAPQGVLATALSTPLMISLARQVFRSPRSDPGELVGLRDVGEVNRLLLDRLLPSAFGDEFDGTRAERWLAFLVNHLPDRPRDPDLLWWRLGRAVPATLITALVSALVTVVEIIVFFPILVVFLSLMSEGAPLSTAHLVGAFLACSGWGLFLGVVAGRQTARSAHGTGPGNGRLAWLTALLTGMYDVLVALATASCAGTVVLLLAGLLDREVAGSAAENVVGIAARLLHGDPRILLFATVGIFLSAIVVTVTNGLGRRGVGEPRHCVPRLRDLGKRLVHGFRGGLLIGAPWTVLELVSPDNPSVGTGLFRTLVVTGLIGIPLGIGRWINSPVLERGVVLSPESVLRGDRNALLLASTCISAGISLYLGFFLWYPGSALRPVLVTAVGIGVTVFVLVLFGSGSTWMSYTVARCWLAVRGRLPWRLGRFLRRAHVHHVIRLSGAAFQVRHDLLRAHLADKYVPGPTRRRVPVWGRRTLSAAGVVLAFALLPTVALFLDR
jgi:hypothetical protein